MKPHVKCTDCGRVGRGTEADLPKWWRVVEDDLLCPECRDLRALYSIFTPEEMVRIFNEARGESC